jgi:spore coat polysaccharide biosynthesis protein SpsF
MNIVIIVQARTASTRLPGKILKRIMGKTVLELQMERMLRAKYPTHIVVATTNAANDDEIVDLCIDNGFLVFRGHPTDLLDRHYNAAKVYDADVVVKIPSDCPLIDPKIIDKVIKYYLDNITEFDFVSNLHPPSYPDGNDVEVMPINILHTAWHESEKGYELEHTTPYIWDNPQRFGIGNVVWETGLNYSLTHRFTIDYPEDFEFIKAIYEELYYQNPSFGLKDIINLLEKKPEIMLINQKYNGVNWYRKHLNDLKTIDCSMTRVERSKVES